MAERGSIEPEHQAAATHRLEVYAMPGCPGWQRAMSLAMLVRTAKVPGVQVRVIDLSRAASGVPEAVSASPTWLLDGHRLAFGNPDPDWLLARLDALPRDP